MLLSALLLAAAVQAPPSKVVHAPEREAVQAIVAGRTCRTPGAELAAERQASPVLKLKKLGDLPPANHTLTVLRSVDGCPVSSTVRYNVDLPAGR